MDKALVSIIVPAYNVANYIEKCIRSLSHQTMRELEIIIVNDGSTDDTGIICEKEAKKDCRIKVIRKQNGGVSSARNEALLHCSGEYIGFVDADDIPRLNMFEILYNTAKKSDADAVICEFETVDSSAGLSEYSGEISSRVLNSDDAIKLVTDFDKKVQVSLWNKIFKREIIKNLRFDTKKFVSEDMEFLLKALLDCEKVSYVKAPLYGYYAQREGSAMYHNAHSIDWYFKQSEFINQIMDDVADRRPSLQNLAVAFKCGNGYMAITKALVRSGSKDDKTIRFVRKKLHENFSAIMSSELSAKKKMQIIVFLSNYKVYAAIMKKKMNEA